MDYSLLNLAALRWFMRIAAARSFLSSGKGLDPTCACKTHFFKGYSRSLSINQPREVSYQSVSAQLFSLGKAIFCPSGRMGYFWRSPNFLYLVCHIPFLILVPFGSPTLFSHLLLLFPSISVPLIIILFTSCKILLLLVL